MLLGTTVRIRHTPYILRIQETQGYNLAGEVCQVTYVTKDGGHAHVNTKHGVYQLPVCDLEEGELQTIFVPKATNAPEVKTNPTAY